MIKGCIVLIIGLPASGKTTFTTKLVNHINNHHNDLKSFHLNFDKVIPLENQKIIVNQLDSSWKENRRHFVSSCQAFLQLIMDPLKCHSGPIPSNHDDTKYLTEIINQIPLTSVNPFDYFCFIVEDNFYYKSMREPFYRLSKQFGLGLCLITLDTPIDLCLQRNRLRSESVDEIIINRMGNRFERPVKDEFGIRVGNTIQLMVINCGDDDDLADDRYDEAVTLIRKSCDTPVQIDFKDYDGGGGDDNRNQHESREISRKVTSNNLIHKFDKMLRMSVNRMIMVASSTTSTKINMGKELSVIRKRFLKRFSDNQLDPGLGEMLMKQETPSERLIQMVMNLIESELEENKTDKDREENTESTGRKKIF